MVELKTLEEIESKFLQTNPPKHVDRTSLDYGFLEATKLLKQEAIKWIKNVRGKKVTFGEKNKFDISSKMFELFFNITEKDLELSAKTKETKDGKD